MVRGPKKRVASDHNVSNISKRRRQNSDITTAEPTSCKALISSEKGATTFTLKDDDAGNTLALAHLAENKVSDSYGLADWCSGEYVFNYSEDQNEIASAIDEQTYENDYATPPTVDPNTEAGNNALDQVFLPSTSFTVEDDSLNTILRPRENVYTPQTSQTHRIKSTKIEASLGDRGSELNIEEELKANPAKALEAKTDGGPEVDLQQNLKLDPERELVCFGMVSLVSFYHWAA